MGKILDIVKYFKRESKSLPSTRSRAEGVSAELRNKLSHLPETPHRLRFGWGIEEVFRFTLLQVTKNPLRKASGFLFWHLT